MGDLVKEKLDYSKISNVQVANIRTWDAPDFTDAFIESADYGDREMTDEELEILNEDRDFVYECVLEDLY